MRFKVEGAHREFFQKNGYIEFESILQPKDISILALHADQILQKRVPHPIELCLPQQLYSHGRDLWRLDTTFSQQISSHSLAALAAELFKKSTLHLAFDQLLRTTHQVGFPDHPPSSLQSSSSIQPLAGSVLIQLLDTPHYPSKYLPSNPGNFMFLSPDLEIPWEEFFQLPHQSYLLIAYAPPEAIYVLKKKDPNTHALKKFGYTFGDRLQHIHHPIVFRPM